MNRLDRYIIGSVLSLTALVGLGLVTIYTLVVFISDIGETGKGSYGVLQVLEYSVLLMPSSLYILLPIVALLGALLGIGALARSSELTAMRASGVSMLRIGAATLAAGALLGAFGYVLGDWLGPAGENLATRLRDEARGEQGSHDRALWLRDADNILRIRRLLAEDHARDVTVFRTDAHGGLAQVSTVDEARYVDGRWLMTGVKRTEMHDDGTRVVTLDQIEISGSITPNVLKLFILEGDVLSVRGLYNLVDYMEENKLDATKYRIWLWRKLVEPVTVMVMMLFAVPFVVGTLRDAGAGQRLLAGVLVGIVFYVLNKVSVSVGDLYQWPAPMAAGLPTALLAVLALWRLRLAR
ncbi:MAG: LPS export ABC transporter permease LptG [Gammaproteobacteria bacterium]|jgi:lipopolysaccharide export system permease protein|nr:LPS export ABC transporter permease LptG [Gammaproteobacteria bacterium]